MEKKELHKRFSRMAQLLFSIGIITVIVAVAMALAPDSASAQVDRCPDGSPSNPVYECDDPGKSGDAPGQNKGGDGDGDGDGGPGNKPGKVGVCHAAGREGTTKFVFISVPPNAGGFPQDHYTNSGTPKAGHEDDFLTSSRQRCAQTPPPGDGDPAAPTGDSAAGVIIPVTGISLSEDRDAALAFGQDAAIGLLGLALIASGVLIRRKSVSL